jgi:uncharacterized protein YbgA (DUF1722 family)
MRLVTGHPQPCLKTIHSDADHTERILGWTKSKLYELARSGLYGFIFKARSPSCGLYGVPIYDAAQGAPSSVGRGLFAGACVNNFPHMPVAEENALHGPAAQENFFTRVFTFKRWLRFLAESNSLKSLIRFHGRHDLLLLSHSPRHHASLNRLLTSTGQLEKNIYQEYIIRLMAALRCASTERKNMYMLHHAAEHLGKYLSPDEKLELREVIQNYRGGLVPLSTPLSLIRHYALLYKESYLISQFYLFLNPLELMLQNRG